MAKCEIGDVTYTITELSFHALEKAWPFIEESMITRDPMKGPSAGLSVIAAGLVYLEDPKDFKPEKFGLPTDLVGGPVLTEDEMFEEVVAYLKRRLKSSQIKNVVNCMDQITEEAGLEMASGDPPPPPLDQEEENLSTATAPSSSANSSPPVAKAEAGPA